MRILRLSLDKEVVRRKTAMKAILIWLMFSLLSIAFVKAQSCPFSVVKSVTSANCGSCNGKADLTVSGGVAPYTYAWSSGGNKFKETGLCAGSYTCTITDNVGCSVIETVYINSVGGASASTTVTDVSCFGGGNGSIVLTGVAGGTAPYSYTWSPAGGTAATASGLTAGTYNCTITDVNGCVGLAVATVNQPAAISSTINQTNVSCYGGTNGTASVTTSGGVSPYSYSWSPSGGNASSASNLAASNYVVTITDSKGCVSPNSVTITQPVQLTATISKTDIVCNNQTNGTATASATGGTAPYTYAWSNGKSTATITALAANSYTCTITDSKGCTTSKSTTIVNPPTWTTSAVGTSVSCKGGSNGTATVTTSGETAPYTYLWSNGKGTNATATGLSAGSYSCTVTDKNGCSKVATITINQPSNALIATGNSNSATCSDSLNGQAWVTVSGGVAPYSFLWNNGQTGQTLSNLNGGTYVCTITDNAGCSKATNVIVTAPDPLFVTFTKKDPSCNGEPDGEATAIATGGTGPYFYFWTTGSIDATNTDLEEGFYEVTVVDGNSCQATETVELKKAAGFTVTITHTDVTCPGGNNGSATVNVTGGTGPFTYEWSPSGGSGSTANGLTGGFYFPYIADANGCYLDELSVQIKSPTPLKANAMVTNESCSGNDGVIKLVPSGGNAPYTYSWAQGGSTNQKTGLAKGTYGYTILDSKNCSLNASSVVSKAVCTSSDQPEEEIAVTIYPNPAKEYIKIDAPYELNEVRLMDMSGREIMKSSNEAMLSLPKMEKGLYFVEITTEKGKIVKKVMID